MSETKLMTALPLAGQNTAMSASIGWLRCRKVICLPRLNCDPGLVWLHCPRVALLAGLLVRSSVLGFAEGVYWLAAVGTCWLAYQVEVRLVSLVWLRRLGCGMKKRVQTTGRLLVSPFL